MSIADEVKRRGLQILGDPRVTKLLQNEQFLRVVLAVAQMPGKMNDFTAEQSARLASSLHLVSEAEYRELARRVEALEAEVDALKRSTRG